jgi:hypothetical protein
MKIRSGFVSNSSSGSFIFPKGMSEEKVSEIIKRIEVFLTDISGKPVLSGLDEPREHGAHVIADTLGDNTCPSAFHHILEDVVGALYDHHG